MNLFYTEQSLAKFRLAGDKGSRPADLPDIRLSGDEAHHAVNVLRMRPGDTVSLTDGKGTICSGKVRELSAGQMIIRLDHSIYAERPSPMVTMCIGLIRKRDRLEFAVEKAVELGVQRIVVWRGDHSEKKGLRADRLESAALSAMKQSLRPWLPEVTDCENLKIALQKCEGSIFMADETSGPEQTLISLSKTETEVAFVIGPEGGFSENERKWLESAGAGKISLGRYRLRTETAVIAIASHFTF
jgi:16S rRNA (uracil1498-N3)-methyltransferase